jgi:hypothetical protein
MAAEYRLPHVELDSIFWNDANGVMMFAVTRVNVIFSWKRSQVAIPGSLKAFTMRGAGRPLSGLSKSSF